MLVSYVKGFVNVTFELVSSLEGFVNVTLE